MIIFRKCFFFKRFLMALGSGKGCRGGKHRLCQKAGKKHALDPVRVRLMRFGLEHALASSRTVLGGAAGRKLIVLLLLLRTRQRARTVNFSSTTRLFAYSSYHFSL